METRPGWEEYFMSQAILTSYRASCKYIQAGAIIVKDKRIISTGYNGAPSGLKNCLENGCRKDLAGIKQGEKNSGLCIGEHAERNAILQISREQSKGSAMYSRLLPCTDCAKQIIGAGIEEVYYFEIYREKNNIAREILKEKGVSLKKFENENLIKLKEFLEGIYNKNDNKN